MAHGVKFANPNRQGGLFSQTVEEPRARTNWSLRREREMPDGGRVSSLFLPVFPIRIYPRCKSRLHVAACTLLKGTLCEPFTTTYLLMSERISDNTPPFIRPHGDTRMHPLPNRRATVGAVLHPLRADAAHTRSDGRTARRGATSDEPCTRCTSSRRRWWTRERRCGQ